MRKLKHFNCSLQPSVRRVPHAPCEQQLCLAWPYTCLGACISSRVQGASSSVDGFIEDCARMSVTTMRRHVSRSKQNALRTVSTQHRRSISLKWRHGRLHGNARLHRSNHTLHARQRFLATQRRRSSVNT